MNPRQIKDILQDRIYRHLGRLATITALTPVSGGSINETYRLETDIGMHYFLKLNSSKKFPGLFEKEKNGLEFLAAQNCIQTPSVLFYETNDNCQLLLLEWIDPGITNEKFWKKFGEQLAQLHRTNNEQFGFAEDNYMGSLRQANNLTNDWTDFFINYRLQPQINLALKTGLLSKKNVIAFESLFKKLDSIFNKESPCLLHGDLWSGNFLCDEQSLPVLIDPAVYFGHRSMDLAMTTLFGGFDKAFYDAYHYHFPLPPGYGEQWQASNLYPLLIHLNLFGKSYLSGIEDTLKKLG
jgi:protein-ribulosamine 3-kinase